MTSTKEVTILFFVIRKLDLTDKSEIEKIFPLINQLRPELNFQSFEKLVGLMKGEEYEIWVYEIDSKFLGAMGLREYTDFVRDKHLYVDDLIVDEAQRSKKIGAKLLGFAEEEARLRALPSLRLSCALTNTGAIKFYEKENWTKRSCVYVKKV